MLSPVSRELHDRLPFFPCPDVIVRSQLSLKRGVDGGVDVQGHTLICPPLNRLREPLYFQNPSPDSSRTLTRHAYVNIPIQAINTRSISARITIWGVARIGDGEQDALTLNHSEMRVKDRSRFELLKFHLNCSWSFLSHGATEHMTANSRGKLGC